ncbi:MAG: translation initiation factor IF-2 [Chitinophagaceae bacterium]|nr:translation initiation factor IF-2 [Chitinophagaceae bacterium]MCW5915268.1 translation initiation factor IF-2 [Chitinophagaceae bacterium]MCZ2396395.1 translation initiation factor IF-2 [Chitinophagales bacterium]
MAEVKTPRVMAAALEFNIGKDTLMDFLTDKGFDTTELKPSSKITEEMYVALQKEFQPDKLAKKKAEEVDLPKTTAPEVKKRKDEQDLSIVKKEPEKPKEEPQPAETTAAKETEPAKQEEGKQAEALPEDDPNHVPVVAPEIDGVKVVGKIDIDTIDSSVRPKKETKPKAKSKAAKESKEPVEEEQPAATITPEEPETKEPETLRLHAKKLTGLTVVDKIDLSETPDAKKSSGEKKKRARIKVARKSVGPDIQHGRAHPNRTGRRNDRAEEKEIDEKEIQDKIRETQAKLAGASGRGKSQRAKHRKRKQAEAEEQLNTEEGTDKKLQVTEFISVSEFASLMDVSFADVISKCMSLGIMVSINQRLEADVIELVAGEFGYEVEFISIDDSHEISEEDEEDDPEDLVPRPPIVTIMGHVDHGKTSLLDYIRHTNIIAGEAGGITQHIGAYEVKLKDNRSITFLDTPGHEAFTAMRARGAKITDIAVIVISADDAVMPQTKEAISHAQAANVPMVFALNKIDKEGANPEKIKEQLAAMNILVEDWGGKYQSQEISAKKGLNVDLLLDKVLLEADLLDLKANPKRSASGSIIEASLDKGRGFVATLLVQTGTLRVGDILVSGQHYGRVKAMFNERNNRVDTAPPSTPVQVLGLNGAPQAGEVFKVYNSESEAKETANKRSQILREQGMRAKKHITLDEIGRRLALGNFKELNLILRADTDGSVEALSDSLQKLSTEEIAVSIVHKGIGQITETDVMLATASDAIIIGFNVRPALQATRLAEKEGVEIKTYTIIYDAIDEVTSAMEGMLEPKIQEKVLGVVEIKETYKFDKATVAGCIVVEGKITRNNRIRLVRDGIIIHTGELGSLKRFKDDVKEVANNTECGLTIKNYSDIKVGDFIESFEEIEVKRTL